MGSSLCRRSAAEAAARPECNPEMLSPEVLKQLRPEAPKAPAPDSIEGKRQRGVRPKQPKYNETPLLTIGKEVRILTDQGFRRASIDCVNESDGTVDVAYEDGDKEDATVPADVVRPLEEFEELGSCSANKDGPTSTEQKRQLGIRPNAPEYSETPLLSIGKLVRVRRGERCFRATIDCVDESDGTVDVVYQAAVFVKDAGVHGKDGKDLKEETVSISAVRALEEFEARKENKWKQAFSDDFHGAVSAIKGGADELFTKIKDYDAAAEYYGVAIDKLHDVQPSELTTVLLNQDGTFHLGKVNCFDVQTQRAFVALDHQDSEKPIVVKAPLQTVIPIQVSQLALQGSLHLNRARLWIQVERLQDAVKDISIVIGLWSACDKAPCREDQLTKAYCLHAKIRFCRMEIGPAKADVAAALDLNPPEATSKILWSLYREIEQSLKDKSSSANSKKEPLKDKQIVKELAKFASTMTID